MEQICEWENELVIEHKMRKDIDIHNTHRVHIHIDYIYIIYIQNTHTPKT